MECFVIMKAMYMKESGLRENKLEWGIINPILGRYMRESSKMVSSMEMYN